MGEWSYQHYDRPCDIVDIATMSPVMSVNANEADMAIEAHNADIAERDRLAAENAELKRERDAWHRASTEWAEKCVRTECERDQLKFYLAAANATLDRLREVVPKVLPPHMSWKDSLDGARAILYPPETTNDDR